jgi:hypothetical protein
MGTPPRRTDPARTDDATSHVFEKRRHRRIPNKARAAFARADEVIE